MGTRVLNESGELTLNRVSDAAMATSHTSRLKLAQPNVQLPLPVEKAPGELYSLELATKINLFLRSKLSYDWKTYAAHYYPNGAFSCRCSTQVFNEVSRPIVLLLRIT